MGDAPVGGCIGDAGGAGANAQAVDHLGQLGDVAGHVKGLVGDGRQNQIARTEQGLAAHGFVACADDDLVNTPGTGFAGFAKTGLHASAALQLQRDMLQDVAGPGAFFQPLQEAAALAHAAAVLHQAGQPGRQALGEAGQGVGGAVFQIADVDQRFDDRAISPNVGAAQRGHAQELDVMGCGVCAHAFGVQR